MKLPLSWLKDLVDLDLGVDELVEIMSLSGLEVEAVTAPGAGAAGLRTARVLHWEPHPDADKLRFVRVTGDGGHGEVEVVCGAANFDVGDVVVHALPGGHVPGVIGPDGTKGLDLTSRPIRGITSHGMLASPKELELGEDASGILVLPGDTPVGASLDDLIPVGEPVIEIAVQADRGDHLSVLGVARDLAAILDTTWQAPTVPERPAGPSIPVTLRTDGCASFDTWVLEDVAVGGSPLWLRQRLTQVGMRPIDVAVDVTNLVMLELGQPLHAFDLDRIGGPSLTVRDAVEGERLVTLDDVERTLVAGDLVIDDADHAVSLAGVMGGADTEVAATTRRILLEGAVWDPTTIRRTSRRLGLTSEASMRFERGVDPAGAGRAVARAAGLLVSLAAARATGSGVVTAEPTPGWAERPSVRLDPARVRRTLAVDLAGEQQAALLERAGAVVTATGAEAAEAPLEVRPPSWRRDLSRPADLTEEVARLHGYDNIPDHLPALPTTGGLTAAQRAERTARQLALAGGFHEAKTRPFVGASALEGVQPSTGRVQLANPLARDAAAMRPSLLEGLLQAVRHNHGQGRPGVALVELGRCFRPVDDPLGAAVDAVIGSDWRWTAPDGHPVPLQPRVIALAAQGRKLGEGWLDTEDTWSVWDVLDVLDRVARRLAPPDDPSWRLERVAITREGFHPGRTAALVLQGQELGVVGQLHPAEAEGRDLPEPVVVGELLLEPFLAVTPDAGHRPTPARTLVRHPAMNVDVALVADDTVTYATLERAVREAVGVLLDELWWFDEYRGAQLGEGRRSVAMRLRLQDPERQLTDADAEGVIDAVAAAAEAVGATLRR
ncbi:MAG: phenylalanine--tRNA ligase subunit beta [Nitriliruptoraceae bacterium]